MRVYDPQWDGRGGWWRTSQEFYPWIYSDYEGAWFLFDATDSTTGSRWLYSSTEGWATK